MTSCCADHRLFFSLVERHRHLPLLKIEPPVDDVVAAYAKHRLMPSGPRGDALHLALASIHRRDFLATWNCKHLANAHKYQHIRRVNALLGLFVPTLATPLELLGDDDGSGNE